MTKQQEQQRRRINGGKDKPYNAQQDYQPMNGASQRMINSSSAARPKTTIQKTNQLSFFITIKFKHYLGALQMTSAYNHISFTTTTIITTIRFADYTTSYRHLG